MQKGLYGVSRMKRINNLYEQIYDFENIYNAYLKARKAKRYKGEVLEFTKNVEENLIMIHHELMYMQYKTGRYFEFKVYEPKERLILALPFKDRVVQHAICNIIEPIFDRTFIFDSYACRKGKGTIAGVKRIQCFVNRLKRKGKIYYLKCDVEKYFNNIDHLILKRLIERKIKCKRTLFLLNEIIDSSYPGIPIGNLTSQLFANIYLNYLDHKIKDEWGVKYYVRYMDDFLILHNDKKYLQALLQDIKSIITELRLKLNHKTKIENINHGIDVLGYRIFPDYTILRKRIYRHNKRKFKKLFGLFRQQKISKDYLNRRIQSFIGICKHCDSYHARQIIFNQN